LCLEGSVNGNLALARKLASLTIIGFGSAMSEQRHFDPWHESQKT
jgi:hypothetical protein